MKKVIVIQTSSIGLQNVRDWFEEAAFVSPEREQILFFDNFVLAERELSKTGPELLITGSFSGDQLAADQLVLKSLARNPNLVTVCFSSRQPICRALYDHVIEKNGTRGLQQLAQLVMDFLRKAP